MKKLFLSFSALLGQIVDGNVTQDDLDKGLFMFGCTRTHAIDPGAHNETDERTWNKGRNAEAYPSLLAALLAAEADGRAAWCRPDMQTRRPPVLVLNELLEKQGMQLIKVSESDGYHLSYPDLKDRIIHAGIALDAIY